MNSKTKLRVDKIIELKHHIENWETQTSEEIENLLIDFEKQPRQEMSSYYTELFRDVRFASVLVQIANKYAENSKINRCIVSALGMMMWRYELPENEEIYLLMLANIQRKGVALYVAFHLPKMKMFESFPDKWGYFMSIPKLSPKKISTEYFTNLVEEYICLVPMMYKSELIQYFSLRYSETKSEYQKERYEKIITSLRDQCSIK